MRFKLRIIFLGRAAKETRAEDNGIEIRFSAVRKITRILIKK